MISIKRLLASVAIIPLALAVSSCAPTSEAGSGTVSPQNTESAEAVVAAAKERVTADSADVKFGYPDGSTAVRNKKVFTISSNQSLEGILRLSNGVVDAVEELGWKNTLIDGKSSPDTVTEGIERAISEGADGIFMVSYPVQYVAAAAAKARAAGIPIISTTSFIEAGPDTVFADIASFEENKNMGAQMGSYAIADSDGTARVILLNDATTAGVKEIIEGAVGELEKCVECQILATVEFLGPQIASGLSEMVRTALLQHPDADYIISPFDSASTFASVGVRDAGRADNIKLLSTGGNLANLAEIRKDGIQKMVATQPLEYYGWVAANAMNDAFLGKDSTTAYTLPTKIIDKDNLPKPGEAWSGDEDYRQQFRMMWE